MSQIARRDRGRALPHAKVLAIQLDLRQPAADKLTVAANHQVSPDTVLAIKRRQHPRQQQVGRCGRCGGKLINKSKPCRVCPLRQSTAA